MAHTLALCGRFHSAVELIGRRWSGAVIHLLLKAPSRYAELRAAIPEITDRMLSERLKELEEEGIVARTVIPETPVRVEYALTAKGRALGPALGALGEWAERWVTLEPAESTRGSRAAETPRSNKPAARTRQARPSRDRHP
ncbi:MAG: helix-turn-helix domain-containing protein [Acidobacteriota bacterium]